jgi:hypothetical protein
MSTLCIIPCGSKKIWDKQPNAGPTEAQHVYIGPFAKKCREYALQFYPSSWCILSAKYGFLLPGDIVPGPYNVSFNNMSSKPITVQELFQQSTKKGLDQYDTILVLGGKNYTGIASKVFRHKEITAPLTGCKAIGYMMGRLNNLILKEKSITKTLGGEQR